MLDSFRSLRPAAFRPALAAAALVGAFVAVPAAARAQSPVVVNFNSLVDTAGVGVRTAANCYTEQGFTFTEMGAACGLPDTFAAASVLNTAASTGTTALYLNDTTSNKVLITRAGSGQFGIQSIKIGPFVGLGGTIDFTGYAGTAQSAFESFTVGNASMFALQPLTLFNFSGAFTGLTSLQMTIRQPDGNAYLNFDDVTLTPSAVPEPTTVALLAGGLFGVGMLARTRGSRRRAASAPLA